MRRTLLITNDFPPRNGGIQSYVHALAEKLPPTDLVVYAPAWDGAAEFDAAQPFPVVRHRTSLILPTPEVAATAAKLITSHNLSALWYGAAAPLALLTPALRRHAIVRSVASTHGHEVGWSMLPGSRQLLRRIGKTNDVITFISKYSRRRISAALGPEASLEYLPAGVDTSMFRPDPVARAVIRERHALGERPVLVCISRLVSRKGQDSLIRAMPQICRSLPEAKLLIVGGGPYHSHLQKLVDSSPVGVNITLAGSVPWPDIPKYYAAGDVFAMPCRTRGNGLDVEGLGIVFLEASATGLAVIAGDSGGAPEAVQDGITGRVVDGRDCDALASNAVELLQDKVLARRMGHTGRAWVTDTWNWEKSAHRLAALLSA